MTKQRRESERRQSQDSTSSAGTDVNSAVNRRCSVTFSEFSGGTESKENSASAEVNFNNMDKVGSISSKSEYSVCSNSKDDEASAEVNAVNKLGSIALSEFSRYSDNKAPTKLRKGVRKFFVDAEEMKKNMRASAIKPPYNENNLYYKTGTFQHIARDPRFEQMTFAVIAINALWIAIDTDFNQAATLLHATPMFQFAEHFFCFYFTLEWLVRLMSIEKKLSGLRDGWFVFDGILAATMILETWVMTIFLLLADSGGSEKVGNAGLFRMARLLRLARIARMIRLFRAMPELLIFIKAMAASLRSCVFVFMLLTLLLYVFGIAFRQLTADTPVGDAYFTSVWHAMHTLWIDGTLLDSTGLLVEHLRHEALYLPALFYVFLLMSALTIMNMLIGVLCEVVCAVAATEKEHLQVTWVKGKLLDFFHNSGLDTNLDQRISKQELSRLLEFPKACKVLTDVGVDVFCLVDNIDFIFEDVTDDDLDAGDRTLSFEEFMTLILDLRGSNNATIKDIVELQKFIKQNNNKLREDLRVQSQRRTTARLAGAISKKIQAEVKKDNAEEAVRCTSLSAEDTGDASQREHSIRPCSLGGSFGARSSGQETLPPEGRYRAGGVDLSDIRSELQQLRSQLVYDICGIYDLSLSDADLSLSDALEPELTEETKALLAACDHGHPAVDRALATREEAPSIVNSGIAGEHRIPAFQTQPTEGAQASSLVPSIAFIPSSGCGAEGEPCQRALRLASASPSSKLMKRSEA